MFKLFSALLVGVLSASLAVIYQNDIAAFLGRAPITAEATPGACYPHFQDLNAKEKFTAKDNDAAGRFSSPTDANFARFVIHNNTGRDIPDAFIKFGNNDWAEYDAVIVHKKSDTIDRSLITNAKYKIELGTIPAADETVVYVWSTQTFGYPFGFDDVSVVGSDGKLPLSVFHFKAAGDSLPLGIATETFAWIMVCAVFGIAVILLIVLHHQLSFIKWLMSDEGYYLEERVRFDQGPDKYTVPGTLPKAAS